MSRVKHHHPNLNHYLLYVNSATQMGDFLLEGPAQCSCDNLSRFLLLDLKTDLTCAARGRTLDWMCAQSSETLLPSTWVFCCDTAPSLLCLSFALLHPITLPSFHLISSALIAPLLSKNNTMVIVILCNKSNTSLKAELKLPTQTQGAHLTALIWSLVSLHYLVLYC